MCLCVSEPTNDWGLTNLGLGLNHKRLMARIHFTQRNPDE
jgi:hypothetical protein